MLTERKKKELRTNEEAFKLYQQKLSVDEIAKKMGCTVATVTRRIKSHEKRLKQSGICPCCGQQVPT